MVYLMIEYMYTIQRECAYMNEIRLESGVILKSIPESPNEDYMAGSDGQVYSRTKYKGFGRKEYVDWYQLQGHTTKKGYQSISMSHNNTKVTKSVHRLICSAFHGTPSIASLQVRHLDGNPSNNRPENLKWGTQEENWQDRRVHGTASVGEQHWASKLTNAEREHLRWAIQKGLCSQHHAAKILGMSQAAIFDIVRTK
jgi:hypothetical protein